MTPFDVSSEAARKFRRAAIKFLYDDLGERGYTQAYMEKMLTDDEYRRYRAMLEEAKETERNRPSPEELLEGNARHYWDCAIRLADSIARIYPTGKSPITGRTDYSRRQKEKISKLVDEAQDLLDFFNDNLTEAEKHNFRALDVSDIRARTFQRLEFDLPVVKSKAETSPYGRLWVYVQSNFLLELLDELTPSDHQSGTALSDASRKQLVDRVRGLRGW